MPATARSTATRRTVVVTGASSGIGLAVAQAFAAEGANLVLASRGETTLAEAATACQALCDAHGGRALAVPTDVADGVAVEALGQQAVLAFGAIDVWVNAAGTSLWGRFEEVAREAHARLVAVNLTGVIHGSHVAVQQMLSQPGQRGVVVNVASFAGRVPVPYAASYTATKFGVAGFTDALRDELWRRSEIAVCGVYPTFVDTPTDRRSANHTGRALRPVLPMLSPERVAAGVLALSHRPQRRLYLGAAHLAAAPYAVVPDTAGRLSEAFNAHHFVNTGASAPRSNGALFLPQPLAAAVRGSWGAPQRRRARAAAGAMALGMVALLSAWAWR